MDMGPKAFQLEVAEDSSCLPKQLACPVRLREQPNEWMEHIRDSESN